MLSVNLTTLSLFALLGLTPVVQAASFDCAKATTTDEKLICLDSSLSRFDDTMAAAYQKARGLTQYDSDRNILKIYQQRWLKKRRACSSAACIDALYRERQEELDGFIEYIAENPDEAFWRNGIYEASDEEMTTGVQQDYSRRNWDRYQAAYLMTCKNLLDTQQQIAQRAGMPFNTDLARYGDALVVAGAVATNGEFMKDFSAGSYQEDVLNLADGRLKPFVTAKAQQCVEAFNQMAPLMANFSAAAIDELQAQGFTPLRHGPVVQRMELSKAVLADDARVSLGEGRAAILFAARPAARQPQTPVAGPQRPRDLTLARDFSRCGGIVAGLREARPGIAPSEAEELVKVIGNFITAGVVYSNSAFVFEAMKPHVFEYQAKFAQGSPAEINQEFRNCLSRYNEKLPEFLPYIDQASVEYSSWVKGLR